MNPHRAPLRRSRQGFTLVEVLIATALLGFSLIVMLGLHGQAVRSNAHARRMTACTYLAQTQLERLLSLPWNANFRHGDLVDTMVDPTSAADDWAFLEHPSGGAQPTPVNMSNAPSDILGQPIYYVTWDIEDMDADGTWTRLRVRCQYEDERFNTWKGTTISSYRFRD